MTEPSMLITFDLGSLSPTNITLNGNTDQETARLKAIADRMLAAIKENDK